jgi:hypothetical protein
LIREASGSVPTGIAVQDGNYEGVNPQTGKRVTVPELLDFATNYLKVDYVFWCTQEPYYSGEVIPFLRRARRGAGALPRGRHRPRPRGAR